MPSKVETVAVIIDDLRRIFQVVNEQSKRAERETGLTGPQLWAIKTISEGAPIRVSEIARRMYLHPATVVGILDRLETHGLVIRTRSTEDRRVVTVELSTTGKYLVKKAPTVAQGLLVTGLAALSGQTLATIAQSLERMVEILGAKTLLPRLILSPEVNRPEGSQTKTSKNKSGKKMRKKSR